MKYGLIRFACLFALVAGALGVSAATVVPGPQNLIAHKGNSGLKVYKENTVAAAQDVVAHGFAFENDVQVAKNGVLYLNHDRQARDYPADWPDTFELTLKMLPTGAVYKVDAKCGLAGLDRLIAAVKADNTTARALLAFNTTEQTFADRIHAELPGAQVWVSVSVPRKKVYDQAKEAEKIVHTCRALKAEGISLRWDAALCTPAFFKTLNDAGIVIDVWTVDKAEVAKEAIRRGARFVTTNRPIPIVAEWSASTPPQLPAK